MEKVITIQRKGAEELFIGEYQKLVIHKSFSFFLSFELLEMGALEINTFSYILGFKPSLIVFVFVCKLKLGEKILNLGNNSL